MVSELRKKMNSSRRDVLPRAQAAEKLSSLLNIWITSSGGRSANDVDCRVCSSISLQDLAVDDDE